MRDKIAKLEHEQWAHWTKYFLNNATPENIDRWNKQIDTPYEQLTEKEKESDRVWADRILELINAERCVWKHEEVWYPCLYYTSCGKFYREEYAEDKPYCPFCGKMVEVKDG